VTLVCVGTNDKIGKVSRVRYPPATHGLKYIDTVVKRICRIKPAHKFDNVQTPLSPFNLRHKRLRNPQLRRQRRLRQASTPTHNAQPLNQRQMLRGS
jgi:hypothetical protein